MKLKDKIVQLLQGQAGLTDREITDLMAFCIPDTAV